MRRDPRSRCRTHLGALLAHALEGEGAPQSLVGYARRLVDLRPCDATGHANLIRLLGGAARTAEAEEGFRVARAMEVLAFRACEGGSVQGELGLH